MSFTQLAILMDVHGTLYYQDPLGCLMALQLSILPGCVRVVAIGRIRLKTLRYFRSTREKLRHVVNSGDSLFELEYLKEVK